jgi:hypothetical protein
VSTHLNRKMRPQDQAARSGRKIRPQNQAARLSRTDALYSELQPSNDNLPLPAVSTYFQPLDPPPAGFYDTPNAAVQAVNLWAEFRDYVIVKKRTKYRKNGGSIYKIWIMCDRGNKPDKRLLETSAKARTNTGTVKTDYPFVCTAKEDNAGK